MKKHIICIMFGQNSEYWNSSISSDNTTKNREDAEGFNSEKEAETELENIVKPFGEKHGWNVAYLVEEV